MLMPSDFPLYDQPMKGPDLDRVLKEISDKYSPEDASKYCENIYHEAFRLSSYVPTSFTHDMFILNDHIKEEKEDLQKNWENDITKFTEKRKKIADDYAAALEKRDVRGVNITTVGAKLKSFDNLLISYGYLSDIEGNIHHVTPSLNDGNNIDEYYTAGKEARRGFYYKSAVASQPGYLARRITMANANVVIDDSKKDCGTKKCWNLTIDKKIAKLIANRYHLVNGKPKLITNPQELIGQVIQLRSPLYCQCETGICPVCYGDSWKILENKSVGVLAGGVINNKALNAYMSATRSIMKSYCTRI